VKITLLTLQAKPARPADARSNQGKLPAWWAKPTGYTMSAHCQLTENRAWLSLVMEGCVMAHPLLRKTGTRNDSSFGPLCTAGVDLAG
jgi:hypothetical protein